MASLAVTALIAAPGSRWLIFQWMTHGPTVMITTVWIAAVELLPNGMRKIVSRVGAPGVETIASIRLSTLPERGVGKQE
jgi:hypothetical protein